MKIRDLDYNQKVLMNNLSCDLTQKHCVPCEGGVSPLAESEYKPLLKQISGWKALNQKLIEKDFTWKDFSEALEFLNKVGKIAEQEGHHPDMLLHDWNKTKISLSTHAIGGLSENDFIVAAKIDELLNNV